MSKESATVDKGRPDLISNDSPALNSIDEVDAQSTVSTEISDHSSQPILACVPGDEYLMNHGRRGKCVIFNHQKFDNSQLGERKGTANDARELEACFRLLKFDVSVHHDPDILKVTKIFEDLSIEDHSDADCLICCFMTHGDEYGLWARDMKYSIELLFNSFTPDACPTLAGKPKIFFIQACPEKQYHHSNDTFDSDSSNQPRDEVDSATYHAPLKIPTWIDFFVAYSTLSDYCSCGDASLGSWFMQTLAKVLKSLWVNSSELALDDIIIKVNQDIDEKFVPSSDKLKKETQKSIAAVLHTFTGKLVFKMKAADQDSIVLENIKQIPMDSILEYSMDRESRGKCVILNHEYFNDPTKYGPRKATNKDADELKTCFGQLGFEVKVYKDYKKKEVEKVFKDLSEEDHSNADCLILCVLTHGSKTKLVAKDSAYDIDFLFEHFSPDNCPTLAGKPKIFFIQACRGEKLDDGYVMVNAVKKSEFSASQRCKRDEPDSKHIPELQGPLNFRTPTWPDFFIAYSTIFGYKSFRNSIDGSWFIQTLIKTIHQFASELSLHELILKVNHDIAFKFISNSDIETNTAKKQSATIVYTATRRLFFNPVAVESDELSIAGAGDIENLPAIDDLVSSMTI